MNNTFKLIIFISLVSLIFCSCATLKPAPPQPEVLALAPTDSGLLKETSEKIAEIHGPDQSAFMLMINNDEALNWRLALIDHAKSSIDGQYFIWEDNETARLLLDRLIKAADRGVRVRLLVDDLPLVGKDEDIAALSNHPYFDIKIFNPGRVRDSTLGAIGEFFLYFRELNRRMHNKLFIVDNQMAIVGGRNIGNPYFGLSKKYNFRDLDALVAGAVIEELSEAFDEYWNVDLSYPGIAMAEVENADEHLQGIRDFFSQYLDESREILVSYPLYPKDWTEEFDKLPPLMKTGEAHVIQDEPVLIGGEEHRLVDMLDYLAEPSHKEITIVTPYLIPVGDFLENLAESGAGVGNHNSSPNITNCTFSKNLAHNGGGMYNYQGCPCLRHSV